MYLPPFGGVRSKGVHFWVILGGPKTPKTRNFHGFHGNFGNLEISMKSMEISRFHGFGGVMGTLRPPFWRGIWTVWGKSSVSTVHPYPIGAKRWSKGGQKGSFWTPGTPVVSYT